MKEFSLNIMTYRNNKLSVSWHLIHEWEDVLQRELNGNLFFRNFEFLIYRKLMKKIIKIISHFVEINFMPRLKQNNIYFVYIMSAYCKISLHNRKNIIPCFIDFHISKKELTHFKKTYNRCPFLLISNKEVFEILRDDMRQKIYHFPLSISDKYKIDETTQYEKKYDLVIAGRQNKILYDFLKTYIKKNPDFYYVYRNEKGIHYTSKGECLGELSSRDEYMALLRKSRIAFYATPGIDGGEKRTNGYNQVTPRFLELVSSQCHIIARYPQNADTEFYKINDFSENIDSYDNFEKNMDTARSIYIDKKKYADYLAEHYTSQRALLLKEILKKEYIYV